MLSMTTTVKSRKRLSLQRLLSRSTSPSRAPKVGTQPDNLEMLLISRFVWGFAAAGPRSLSQAMGRDRYSGDAMARIMTMTQTVFFIAPIAAPLIGKGLLELGGWRWTMGFGLIPAGIIAIWVMTIEETLAPENKRPLQVGKVFEGFRLCLLYTSPSPRD